MKLILINYTNKDDIRFIIKDKSEIVLSGMFKFDTEALIIFHANIKTIDEAIEVHSILQKHDWYTNHIVYSRQSHKVAKLFKKALKRIRNETKTISEIYYSSEAGIQSEDS